MAILHAKLLFWDNFACWMSQTGTGTSLAASAGSPNVGPRVARQTQTRLTDCHCSVWFALCDLSDGSGGSSKTMVSW